MIPLINPAQPQTVLALVCNKCNILRCWIETTDPRVPSRRDWWPNLARCLVPGRIVLRAHLGHVSTRQTCVCSLSTKSEPPWGHLEPLEDGPNACKHEEWNPMGANPKVRRCQVSANPAHGTRISLYSTSGDATCQLAIGDLCVFSFFLFSIGGVS